MIASPCAAAAPPRGGAGERVATVLIWASALTVCALFFWLLATLVVRGSAHLSLDFLLSAPRHAGRAGGIGPILVSTFSILAICLSVSLPLGLGTAVLLSEFTQDDAWFGRTVRCSLDVLAGVPSIVFGLFGNALFCKTLKLGFSLLSGGLTLACMVLPLLIRATEEGFRSAPRDLRLAAAALGMSRTATVIHLLLPAAAPGLAVGLVLGIGRALAETAALLFTSGYADRMPGSLLDSGRTLSVHIFDLAMNVAGGDSAAYATALVLVLLLVFINMVSSWLIRRWLRRNWLCC